MYLDLIKKWIEVHDQSGEWYNINKKMRFKTSMLRPDIRNYSDAYIVIKRIINLEGEINRA